MILKKGVTKLVTSTYFIIFGIVALILDLVGNILQISTIPYLLEAIAIVLIVVVSSVVVIRLSNVLKTYFDRKFMEIESTIKATKISSQEPAIDYEVAKSTLVGKFRDEGLLTKRGNRVQIDIENISVKTDSLELLGRYLVAVLSTHPRLSRAAFIEGSASHILCVNYKKLLTLRIKALSFLLIKAEKVDQEIVYQVSDKVSSEEEIVVLCDRASDGSDLEKIAETIVDAGGLVGKVIVLYDDEKGAEERLRQRNIRLVGLLTRSEVLKFYD